MRIYSLSKIVALPFGVAFAMVLYWSMDYNHKDISIWLIPLGIILVLIFVFHPQLDFWWHRRNPPPIDRVIVDWLEKYSSYYKKLLVPDKIKFLKRLSIYLHAKEFVAQGQKQEGVPEDIKAIIGHSYIMLSMGLEDYLLKDYDRIVLYKHPFPTPEKKFLHSVETHPEDGVIILSMEQLISGLLNQAFYNVGLHAYAEAFVEKNPSLDYPEFENDIWERLEQISGISVEQQTAILGFEQKDPLIVTIVYFFDYPQQFLNHEPKLYIQMINLFQQDPMAPSMRLSPKPS